MMSTFVSQVRSKLEQKPKAEKERRIPAKEPKSSPEKPKRDAEAGKVGARGRWRHSQPQFPSPHLDSSV